MGSSVNYVVVRDGQVTQWYSSGGAGDGLDYHFGAGPDIVLRWLSHLDQDLSDEWVPDPLNTGSVLIDVDRNHLLLFSGLQHISVNYRFLFHRAILDGYPRAWPGWTVEWAYDGVADLLRYLGLDVAQVRAPWDDTTVDLDTDRIGSVVTVGDKVYAVNANTIPWRLGPAILDQLGTPGATFEAVPLAGMHIDVQDRWVGIWGGEPLGGLVERWPTLWPGWELRLWRDDLAKQVDACGGALVLPPVDLAEGLQQLASRVGRHWMVEERMNGRYVEQLKDMWSYWGGNPELNARITEAELTVVSAAIRGETLTPRDL